MCKLAYIRTRDGNAYKACIDMLRHQENVVAGHSTGLVWLDADNGFHIRKAIGKINSFLAKYPDFPSTKECLGHSRYASVGAITIENQHPIPIIVNGKTIGYGVHNGTFRDYVKYEHLRGEMQNKTDSALLMTMYSKMLQRLGDTENNRRVALSYIMSLIQHAPTHNIIIMFRNDMVLFSGDVLTYKVIPNERVGIMTFGLSEKCNPDLVYQIRNMNVQKYKVAKPPFRFKAREPKKQPNPQYMSCEYSGGRIPERLIGWERWLK